jgi:hypothetical protein
VEIQDQWALNQIRTPILDLQVGSLRSWKTENNLI